MQFDIIDKMPIHKHTIVLKWKTPEYIYVKNSNDWFWGIGVITLAGTILAFFYGNHLFGVLILIGAFLVVIYSTRRPDIVSVEISDHGVKVDKVIHSFSEYDHYWIYENVHGEVRLLLHTTRKFFPIQVVPVAESVDINQLREFLQDFLVEYELREPLFNRLFDHYGF